MVCEVCDKPVDEREGYVELHVDPVGIDAEPYDTELCRWCVAWIQGRFDLAHRDLPSPHMVAGDSD